MHPTLYPPADRRMINRVSGAFEQFINLARTYLIEYRKAKAAEQLYQELSRLSDAELARFGLRRKDLPQFVKERVYGASEAEAG